MLNYCVYVLFFSASVLNSREGGLGLGRPACGGTRQTNLGITGAAAEGTTGLVSTYRVLCTLGKANFASFYVVGCFDKSSVVVQLVSYLYLPANFGPGRGSRGDGNQDLRLGEYDNHRVFVHVIERCSRYYFVNVENSGTFVLVDSSSSWSSSSMSRLMFAGEVTGRAS